MFKALSNVLKVGLISYRNTVLLNVFIDEERNMRAEKVRERNIGTGTKREPGGQWSKNTIERERRRDREWCWMKEREDEWREQAEPWPPRHAQWFQFRNKLANFSWHAPWQPHLFQLFTFIFRFQTVESIHVDWRDNYATLVWIQLMFTHNPLLVKSLAEVADVQFVCMNLCSSWVSGHSTNF